jgi:hypothetical protein
VELYLLFPVDLHGVVLMYGRNLLLHFTDKDAGYSVHLNQVCANIN